MISEAGVPFKNLRARIADRVFILFTTRFLLESYALFNIYYIVFVYTDCRVTACFLFQEQCLSSAPTGPRCEGRSFTFT